MDIEIEPEDTLYVTKEMLDPIMGPLLLEYGEWIETPRGKIKKLPLNWLELRAKAEKEESAAKRKKFRVVK